MCEPVTLAMAALSIAGGVANAQGQQRVANRQAEALGRQADADQAALALQANQEATASAQEMNERNRQARIEAAAFDTMVGEMGGGVSMERSAAEMAFNHNTDLATIKANRDMRLSQIGMESQGVNGRMQGGLASLQRPSRMGTALTIAGNLASVGRPHIDEYQRNKRYDVLEERRKVRYGQWVENNRMEGAKDLRPNRAGA